MLNQISNEEIGRARNVLSYFVVNSPVTRESALESGIFAILNQASRWERPSLIVYKLREASHPKDKEARSKMSSFSVLTDKDLVQNIARKNGWRFYHERRLDSFIDHFREMDDKWWNKVVEANSEYRNEVVSAVKYVNLKTFSFWHLCLGGKDLLPIDIHVRRQLFQLEVPIEKKYIQSRQRMRRNGEGHQNVVDEPDKSVYLEIEKKAKQLFAEDDRFKLEGKTNMALVASVLWWRGAHRGEAEQGCLFNGRYGGAWKLPYGSIYRELN